MKSVALNLGSLKPNLEWASLPLFDRSGWKRVRFGDVVENCAETCDPQEAGLERFIAMEHMEPGSLHIRSWGNVADGTTFTRRCRPGQVLFGKRRAYQRKVAVAEFEAVVSGDIYVLAPKDDRLLPELLPFLCLSERFFQHAVGTSAGSLSPRTNWSSLANFEFDLPPLDQQRRIAEILWAVDEAITCLSDMNKLISGCADAARNDHFLSITHSKSVVSIRDIGRWVSGNTPSRKRDDYWSGDFPWVSPKDMKKPVINDAEEHLSSDGRKDASVVGAGSLLIVIRGMILVHSFPLGITTRDVAFNQDMKALIPNPSHSVEYVYHWFCWAKSRILSCISDSSHGTKRLAMEDLFAMYIPTPSLSDQSKFTESIQRFENASQLAKKNIHTLVNLRTGFLNHMFSSP
jgi:type I restriction enzyme S subunit